MTKPQVNKRLPFAKDLKKGPKATDTKQKSQPCKTC